MRVIVTGASGFVGRRIVVALAAAGHAVVAASRQPLSLDAPAEWRQSPDLGAHADWRHVITGADAVVHAAARVHVMKESARDPLDAFRRANVEGTARLARQAADAGARRFIFISSIKVNGETTSGRGPFRGTDEPAPKDPYGISKWEAERALVDIGTETGMQVASIRPVLVLGPGVKGNLATLARAAVRGWPLPLGAVKNRRSLVHVDNLADLVGAALNFPGALPTVMLVRDNESLSTAELLRRLARFAGREAWVPAVPPQLLVALARALGRTAWSERLLGSLEVDDTATRETLGWTPAISLDEGLAQMASDLRSA
jgi:nucleoside-diphosphate-sugar epimerase